MIVRRISRITASLLASLLPAALLAQTEPKGVYVTAYGQFSRIGSSTFTESGAQGAGSGLKANFGGGVGLGGDVGYRFGNGWAVEFEWNYRTHSLGTLSQGGTTLARDGDFASNIVLINGLRRFASTSRWTPYVGAGIGWVVETDIDLRPAAGGTPRSYSASSRVAPQLIAGVEYAFTRKWRLATDARWLRVGSFQLDNASGNSGGAARPLTYNPLSAQVGLRYSF